MTFCSISTFPRLLLGSSASTPNLGTFIGCRPGPQKKKNWNSAIFAEAPWRG